MSEQDQKFMGRALRLARRGWGAVAPNPMVGAVVVRDGRIVAEGWHRRFGGPHAEVEALKRFDGSPENATLYVTLEPCSHYGKTPPCTEAILKSGIRKVVVACLDPNPKAKGGVTILREAGVQCVVGVKEREALALNRIFFHALKNERPFIGLKLAMTLNGRIALGDGRPRWITSPQAKSHVHRLRALYRSITAGKNTLLLDDPQFNIRHGRGEDPLRLVMDPKGVVPHTARVFAPGEVWYMGPERGELASHVRQIPASCDYDADWQTFFSLLKEEQVDSLLLEGGGEMARFFMERGWIDRLHIYTAPRFFPQSGVEGFPLPGHWGFEDLEVSRLGETILWEGRPICLRD